MTRDTKIDLALAVGAAAAFVLGLRRVSGVLGVGAGVWYLTKDRKLAGASSIALGGSLLAFPDWPAAAGDAVRLYLRSPQTTEPRIPAIPAHLAQGGKYNLDLGGGWTLLDVSAAQSPTGRAMLAAGLKVGTVVPLALSYHGATPALYQARTISTGETGVYFGQWQTRAPPGGPQAVDFRREHVLL